MTQNHPKRYLATATVIVPLTQTNYKKLSYRTVFSKVERIFY